MIAIVVHLELPLMFKFKILMKLKSEITGLKKQILLRSALYSFLDRPGKKCTHIQVYLQK